MTQPDGLRLFVLFLVVSVLVAAFFAKRAERRVAPWSLFALVSVYVLSGLVSGFPFSPKMGERWLSSDTNALLVLGGIFGCLLAPGLMWLLPDGEDDARRVGFVVPPAADPADEA